MIQRKNRPPKTKIAPTLQFTAGKKAGYNAAILKFASASLILAVCWCSAGLLALDFATILPTSLSPLLNTFRLPVKISTTAILLCIPPVTHILGCVMVPEYKAYQPLKGGARFIYLQASGWCIYAACLTYVCSDVIQVVYPPASFVCIHCQSGFLIALAVMMVVGNSLLIGSLFAHETVEHSYQIERIQKSLQKEKATTKAIREENNTGNTDWSLVVDVFLIAVAVFGMLILGLKHHPGLHIGKEKDAYFATEDGVVELPFCEKPYQFSSHLRYPFNQIAQLPSAILHMPYVPILNLVLYYGCPSYKGIQRGKEQIQVIVGLLIFQFWTGVGHIHPNPRKLFIQETSIMLSLIVLRAFVNSMTTNEKYKIGTGPFLKLLVFMLSSYIVVGLMPTIIITNLLNVGCITLSINGQDLCRPSDGNNADSSRVARKNLKELVKEIMPDLTSHGKIILASLMILSIGMLFLETQICHLLLEYNSSISWHAPFDFFFWQGFWTFVQVVALSKPGSVWRKDPIREKEKAIAFRKQQEDFKFPLAAHIVTKEKKY